MGRIRGLLAIAGIAAATAGEARGDDLFKGLKGPTHLQLDARATLTRTPKGEVFTQRDILKYWPEKPYWLFVNAAWSSKVGETGFNDIKVGGGPRLLYSFANGAKLGFLAYGAATLQTGTHGFGTGRTDLEAGIYGTYLEGDWLKGDWQADVAASRVWAGKNDMGVRPHDSTSAGILIGRGIGKKLTLGAGAGFSDNGETTGTYQAAGRYTFSKNAHAEANARYTPSTRTTTIEGRVRVNF